MRALLLAALLLALCAGGMAEDAAKLAENLDMSGVQRVADEAGASLDAKAVLIALTEGEYALEPARMLADLGRALLAGVTGAMGTLAALAVPAVISAAVNALLEKEGARSAVYACCLCGAGILSAAMAAMLRAAQTLADTAAKLSEAIFPVLTLLLTSAGGATSASVLTPAAALFSLLTTRVLRQWGVRLACMASILALAGALGNALSFGRLYKLIKGAVNWGCGILMTLFLGLLSVQGALTNGYDSLGARAARYAVDSMVPVIGGEVADTLDAMAASVLLVKNAAGVTGMVVALAVCLKPLVTLASGMVSLRLAAALMESAADRKLTEMTDRFAGAAQMLLTLCAASVVMLLTLLGAALAAGGNLVR